MYLYEILVPTIYGDTLKPIRTKHHKEWDKAIKKITGGLTIMSPAKGQWIHQGKDFDERVIPVRLAIPNDHTTSVKLKKIVDFTLTHYRQKAVMYYRISDHCVIKYAPVVELEDTAVSKAVAFGRAGSSPVGSTK